MAGDIILVRATARIGAVPTLEGYVLFSWCNDFF
jgi:hypothetical protein